MTNQSTHAARASWYNGGAKYLHGSAEQVTVNATINGTGLNARLYRGASSNSIGTLVNGTNLSASGTITYALNSAEFALESRIVGASAPDGTVTITATCTAPVPIISDISPASGPTGGGTNVTLTGSYLANASMTVDGATVTPTSASDTSIVFTTPAHAAGAVTVSLTTPGGSASNSFTYVSAPTVTSISPTAGPTGGGTTVIITGTGFSAAGSTGAVKFGAANATYAINSNTQITATSPANSAGTYDITVTTPGGTSAVLAADQFTYVPAPTVTSISSTSGPSSGGTTVTITGTNFSGATAVAFGGVAATGYTVLSGTSIAATAPAGTGTVDIRVTTTGGTSAASAADQYTYIPAPTVSAISPMAGPTAGGTSVTITGADFTGVTAVTFGGSAAVGFTFNSASSITAIAPSGTGTADIRVTTPGGTSATSAADRFAYLAPITLSPAAGALPGGTARNAYSQTFMAGGGSTPYTFSFTGSLPSGLTLSAGGVLSGTPTASGTFNFTIDVSDNSAAAAGSAFTASQSYSITIVKAAQTINFGSLSNVSLSASPVSVLATADSGLTVGFTSSTTGVCTVSGGSVTLLDLGVCTINADQAGDAAYEVAPTVTRSFTVTPATLTINSAAATGLQVGVGYSQANTAAGGLAPYTYSLSAGAFVPGAGVDTATGVVSGTPTVAGSFSYIVRVTDGQPLFADTSVTTVNIAKGNQTISFTSTAVGASVGGAYNVTATASSGLTPTVLIDASAAAVCSISGGSVTFQSTGTCVINANQAGDPNWNAASQVQQSFSVGAAAAISSSISFSSSSLGVGETGVATITFTNPNASASPSIAPLFHGSALVSRVALGGSCGASGSDSGANFQFNGFSIPSGSCTVTISYTGVTAGSTSGFVLGAFTPSGYPATSATGGAGFAVVPTVTGVSPNSGPGSQVTTISGTGFSTTPGNNTVVFGAAGSGVVTAASATSLTVTAPAVGSGPMAVTVSVNGQTSTTSGVFTFINAPIAADKTGVAVPYNSAGAAIDLSGSISGGPHNSIAIGTAAQHGTTTIAGDVVTYTPAAGYFGADSFTYTASGSGGTSNVATVSIVVATPAAPVAADRNGVAIPYNDAGTAIDLSGAITGVHASIAIATAPAHGSVSVAGDVITYTPSANYYGADSFTYTATGPGGVSAPATVGVVVATPAAPVAADKSGVAIPYNGAGTPIDLSGAITGVHSSIAIATAPAHGSASVAGDVITYTPSATYYGADSFTYTVAGPGGTSAPATVSLTVATPPAPVVTPPADPVAVPPSQGGGSIAVDLGAVSQGVVDGFRITVTSLHGAAELIEGGQAGLASMGRSAAPSAVGGVRLVYTPVANFMGTDTVTVVAYGPGGDSAPVTFTFQVAGKAPDLTAAIASNAVVRLSPTAGLVGGPFNAVRITRAPAFGTATVDGLDIVFTPGAANGGATSLDYVVDLPFGPSAAGRIDLTSNLVPGAQALTVETLQGVPVTVRISNTVGGPFTGAAVVSINPANAGSAVVTGAGAEWNLTFTPDAGFSGQAVATFSLTNAAGTTNGTLAIAVEARPDPSQNVEVRGVATAQVTSARRFADAQLNNFQRRLQALHDGSNGSSNGLSLNLGFGGQNDLDNDPRAALRRQFGGRDQTDPGAMDDRSRDMLGLDIWADRKVGSETADISADRRGAQSTSGGSGRAAEGGSAVGFWTAGAVDWGRQDADGQRDYRFSTQGVTAGLDVRVSDRLIVGGGLGYGEDKTKIGDNGSISRGSALTGALYASWRPAEAFYIDGVVGYADLDFDARRWTEGLGGQPDGYSASERSGDVRFASAAFGRLLRGGGMTTDLYARVDAREIALDGFTETGGGYGSLIWDEVEQSSLSANLGAAWRWTVETRRYGRITPSARVEWSHELEDVGMQGVRYADWAASPTYLVPLDAWSRNAINVNLGAEWSLTDQLMFSLGYRSNLGDASTSHGAEIRLKYGW
ncbi:IPT/TIG domain-containing protein [Brevundimonas faecalis]